MTEYQEPVNKLLLLGEIIEGEKLPDYLGFGINESYIPDLIRMSLDDEFNNVEMGNPKVWGPLHAIRALGLLKAKEAIEPLMNLFEGELDWFENELFYFYERIGKESLPTLEKYLNDKNHGVFARATASNCIKRIGKVDIEAKDECVKILTEQLEKFNENDPEINAFIIGHLMDLKAESALSTINQAFESKNVDESIVGDWEDIQIHFGLLDKRTKQHTFSHINQVSHQESSFSNYPKENNKKKKNKKKMEKSSRKRNRRR